ncbi:hypothetical protein PIB30_065387 [Stylosanthes scabra]|uniref:Transposase MuDR plant domain-containing protein n=1 Tax=Stylosanthes scabra TaxID=79078 RepID=A0ABU6SNG9_9FABA|nr:hypothetical protein [Stylosanthes scabra]
MDEIYSEDDEGGCLKKFPVHKELKDMSNNKWEVGTLYTTRDEFKDVVNTYVVHNGRNIKFLVVKQQKCGHCLKLGHDKTKYSLGKPCETASSTGNVDHLATENAGNVGGSASNIGIVGNQSNAGDATSSGVAAPGPKTQYPGPNKGHQASLSHRDLKQEDQLRKNKL